jgi:hypothetical protein
MELVVELQEPVSFAVKVSLMWLVQHSRKPQFSRHKDDCCFTFLDFTDHA